MVTEEQTASYLPAARPAKMPSQATFLSSSWKPASLGHGLHVVGVEADDLLLLVDELHGRPGGVLGDDIVRDHAAGERQGRQQGEASFLTMGVLLAVGEGGRGPAGSRP